MTVHPRTPYQYFSLTATLLLSVVLLAGCSLFGDNEGEDRLSLTRDRSTYQPGDAVMLTLANQTDSEVEYNLCLSQLQVRDGTRWKRRDVERGCILVQRILQPGNRATYSYQLPEQQAESRLHRLQTTVGIQADEMGERTLRTKPFTIEAAQ